MSLMRDQRMEGNLVRCSVSASELAQMGVCERLMMFERRYGKRRGKMQWQSIQRGNYVHRRFYCDGKSSVSAKGFFILAVRFVPLCVGE